MSFYSEMGEFAAEMVTEYGQEFTFTRVVEGSYDPDTGTSTDTQTTYTAYCVKDTYSKFERSNSAIDSGDIRMICEVADFAVNDTAIIDSLNYKIIDVEPIKPGPIAVAYILQMRK